MRSAACRPPGSGARVGPEEVLSMAGVRQAMTCPGPSDRRTWLQLGAMSLGALAAGPPIDLARLLAAQEGQPGIDRDFSVILFWANGGPSHLETFDLKPQAPEDLRGPFQPIATNVPGIEITELLPRLARMADRFALVRSLHHERFEHSGGTSRFLSGYPSRAANPADGEYPEIGSVVARYLDDHGRSPRNVPAYVANTRVYGGGPAYLGPAHGAFMPQPNPLTPTGNNTYDPVPIDVSPDDLSKLTIPADARPAFRDRSLLLRSFDSLRHRIDGSGTMSAMDRFEARALDILTSSRTRDAFDLARESERTCERYGQTHWGRSLLTARRLVEAGVRFVQCQANFRLPEATGRISTWDDHSVNCDIFQAYRDRMPVFDQAVTALLEDLASRGLDRHVLFIFCGEFGRTPRILRQDPATRRPGRDHWAHAMSVFLAGGGLRMGQVVGATNSRGEMPVERIMNSNCLLATIYRRFGVDPRHRYTDLAGRPIPILSEGEPISELM